MCGRFSQAMTLAQLLERFHLDSQEEFAWQVRYNVAPSLEIPVLVNDGRRTLLERMRWGLVVPWAVHNKKPMQLTNLRSDTLMGKPGFRKILETARCLVPIDGFNEWAEEKGKKQPYRFVMRSGEIFCLAGLYQRIEFPDGQMRGTVSLITTDANLIVSRVHDRMPVIVPRDIESIWLNPKSKLHEFSMYLSPYPPNDLTCYPVTPKLNATKDDTPDLIAPLR